jgi:hypothetical protein
MARIREGTSGGTDLLDPQDRITDSERSEKIEPLNERIEDSLTAALQAVLRRDPGGYVAQKQYVIMRENLRDTEIVFDRFYFMLNLLVDMLPSPMSEPERVATEAHVKEHAKYAQQSDLKYLPIVGTASLSDIENALR